ncbi:Ig domain-containing protein [Streptacidiphilus anmyonensis]|uniref:Ig domain-containing protein n=1 Tax=Streptacidiphilus anmyonensis TaxID=405782 RepID=UPI0006946871|nr:Ig domain-containing protein [Streptacidiphilus anmyonensis]
MSTSGTRRLSPLRRGLVAVLAFGLAAVGMAGTAAADSLSGSSGAAAPAATAAHKPQPKPKPKPHPKPKPKPKPKPVPKPTPKPTPKPVPKPKGPADAHPAAEGWVKINGVWVQSVETKPQVMLNQQTFTARKAQQQALAAEAAAHDKSSGIHPHNDYDLNMTYRGGQDSIGVTTGPPQVYLVYWGSQWGTAGTDASGHTTFSGDPEGASPYQQDFFNGLGSSTDTWSKVPTQYCENISQGSVSCPAGANHVGYPVAGKTLAGIWYDNSAAAPAAATEPQIAAEALAAAQHFGNTTANQNRNVQYIINTVPGADPDHWQELGYCAWHTFARSSYGTVAYTLMPYLTDNKYCGTNWINSGQRGHLDGYGIIGGHEYAETIDDQNPIGAWTDATGQEIADKCSWIPAGTPGGLFNLTLSTGVFPVQTLWSNYDHNCMGNDPLFANQPLLVTKPCDQTQSTNSPIDYAVLASDTASTRISYSATGLPAGLAINPGTGHITGQTSATGWYSVTVTASDDKGNSQSQTSWMGFFNGPQVGCTPIEQLNDAGFENSSYDHTVWNESSWNVITEATAHQARTGNGYAWLGQNTDDSVTQWVETTPGYKHMSFSFYLDVTGTAPSGSAADTMSLVLYDQYTGNEIGVVKTWSNQDATNGYQLQSFDLTPWVASEFGSTVGLKLVSHSTTGQTAFLVDDASVHLT